MVVKTSKKRCKNIAEKFGGKEKVRIFAARLRNNGKFTDNTERDNEVKKIEIRKSVSDNTRVNSYMSVAAQFQGNEKNEIRCESHMVRGSKNEERRIQERTVDA